MRLSAKCSEPAVVELASCHQYRTEIPVIRDSASVDRPARISGDSAAGARCHLTTVRRSHCHTYHNSATADICVNKPLLYRSRRECEEEEEEDVVKVIARNVMTKQPLASQQRHKSVELHSWLLNVNIALILRRLVILIQEVMACK